MKVIYMQKNQIKFVYMQFLSYLCSGLVSS